LKSPTKIHHSPPKTSPILSKQLKFPSSSDKPQPAEDILDKSDMKVEENDKIKSLELRLAGTI
jgi:hypothetical protein